VRAGGAIVYIEPSPYEFATLAAMVMFFATGLRMRLAFVPLLMLLFLINIGYTICAIHLMDKTPIVNWIMTSWYMAVTVIFFALVFSEDTEARLDLMRRGLIVGAVVASVAGVAGYFHLVPGEHDVLTLYGRARGTFKDPNVLSAFLILPALFVLQSVVSDRFGKAVRSAIALGIISLALLLAFSRAAWGQFVLTSAAMLVLMFLTSPSRKQRSRLVVTAAIAAAAIALLLAILLSLDSVESLFKERASFDQSYDEGRFGGSAGTFSASRWRWTYRSESARCSSRGSFRKTLTTRI
jgi:O-antigen ligase